MRHLLLILGLLMLIPEAYALRGGPFDSSSNQAGLDPRRGTFRTVVRGENVIGYCTYSSSSNLDSYGSCRFWIDGVSSLGNASGLIEEDTNLVFFSADGVSEQTLIGSDGYVNLDVDSTGYPYRASGEGEIEIRRKVTSQLDRLTDLGLDFGSLANAVASQDDVFFSDEGSQITAFLQLLSQLESSPFVGTVETERRKLTGETRQTSLLPSLQFFTIINEDGSQNGPIAIDPTDTEEFINIINQLGS